MVDTVYSGKSRMSTNSTNTAQSHVRKMHSAANRNSFMRSLEKQYKKENAVRKIQEEESFGLQLQGLRSTSSFANKDHDEDEIFDRQERMALQFQQSQSKESLMFHQQKIDERKRVVEDKQRKLRQLQERKRKDLAEKKLALEARQQKLAKQKEEQEKQKKTETLAKESKEKERQRQNELESQQKSLDEQQRRQEEDDRIRRVDLEKQQLELELKAKELEEQKLLIEEKGKIQMELMKQEEELKKKEMDRKTKALEEQQRRRQEEAMKAKEQAEIERLAREAAENERLKIEEELRLVKEQSSKERVAKEKADLERFEREKAEAIKRAQKEKLEELEKQRQADELERELERKEMERASRETEEKLRKELEQQKLKLEEKQRKLEEAEIVAQGQQLASLEQEMKTEMELQEEELVRNEQRQEASKNNASEDYDNGGEILASTVGSISSLGDGSYLDYIHEDVDEDVQFISKSAADEDEDGETLQQPPDKHSNTSSNQPSTAKKAATERKTQLQEKKQLDEKKSQLELEYVSEYSRQSSNGVSLEDDGSRQDDVSDDACDSMESGGGELDKGQSKKSRRKKKKAQKSKVSARERKRRLEDQYASQSSGDDDSESDRSFAMEPSSRNSSSKSSLKISKGGSDHSSPRKHLSRSNNSGKRSMRQGSDHSSPQVPTSKDEADKLRKAFEEGMQRGMSLRNMNSMHSGGGPPPPPVRKTMSLDPSQRSCSPRVQRGMSMNQMGGSMPMNQGKMDPMSRSHHGFQRNNSAVRGLRRQLSVRPSRNFQGSLQSATSGDMIANMEYGPGPARPGYTRAETMRLAKGASHRSMGKRSRSVGDRQGSGLRDFTLDEEQPIRPMPAKNVKGNKMDYERPPKSLVLIWLVVAGELGFDLGTTVIAFRSLLEEDDCCGTKITLGPVPMSLTAPFFLLVAAELALLIRAIMMTLFPNWIKPVGDDEEEVDDLEKKKVRSCFMRYFCCYLRWKVRIIMQFLGILVLLNPFFGCLIAWILLYQSDKTEALMVLGFEGGSLLLHYVSVYLEGTIKNCWTFIVHALIPLIPFTAAVGLAVFYLKQGGICYVVEDALFKFNGCEVCANGYPPDHGICQFPNGTNYTWVPINSFSADNLNSLEGLTSRSEQFSYCASANPEGPATNFCFFDFEEGKLPGVVVQKTDPPAAVPSFSTNVCGGSVPTGPRDKQCRKYLWGPAEDVSLHCIAFGGPGDPCQLSVKFDGSEGRFKNPSTCEIETVPGGGFRSYGDTFFLWDEPDLNGKDYAWAGNAWVAYSARRFQEEIAVLREEGLRVTTPLFNFANPSDFRSNVGNFFDGCRPLCNEPNNTAYVDIIAVNILCDHDEDPLCRNTAESTTSLLQSVSGEHGNRPVFVTKWGMVGTEEPENLARAMRATDAFFAEGSVVERIYWYGGDRFETTNLNFQARPGQDLSLGDLWVEKCDELSLLRSPPGGEENDGQSNETNAPGLDE